MRTVAKLKLRKPTNNNVQHLFMYTIDVMHCEYSFYKEVDDRGEVRVDVLSGNIKVVIGELPSEMVLNWVFDTQKKYNGEIVFLDEHQESIDKLYFDQGRCIDFKLHYEPGVGSSNVLVVLTINAQRMIVGDVEYKNSY